jgi:hypothetical protein
VKPGWRFQRDRGATIDGLVKELLAGSCLLGRHLLQQTKRLAVVVLKDRCQQLAAEFPKRHFHD